MRPIHENYPALLFYFTQTQTIVTFSRLLIVPAVRDTMFILRLMYEKEFYQQKIQNYQILSGFDQVIFELF